ncbi:hypothetical protein X798_02702 [Onchocerca flexuosa]|uniref:Ovule protein n=2 Tax=Onchocerca flexuosa TaxID=387005 RepID=A0A183H1Z8_9BILA|nr:hypothetical protein X798_02702 [Onchocerca flexuosa]VDO29800.1 unnamed protein product [Onchocerca flexuosa]
MHLPEISWDNLDKACMYTMISGSKQSYYNQLKESRKRESGAEEELKMQQIPHHQYVGSLHSLIYDR